MRDLQGYRHPVALRDAVARLAGGSTGRTEADVQADIRAVLLDAPLDLENGDLLDVSLEAQAGGGKRIDIEAGCAVIEVKKSLGSRSVREAALAQLAGYVRQRTVERSQRFVGVLTDGQAWLLFHLEPDGELTEVSRLRLRGGHDSDRLTSWLEALLATTGNVSPTPGEIVRRLGADSPATQLDLADLRSLYAASSALPEVQVKRELWGRLLLVALGTSFEDSDELFVTHTYLVLTAELIAHRIMRLPTDAVAGDVRDLLEGQQFATAGLHGVVEADFFDWPAVVPQGQPVVAGIARRLGQFDWSDVEHDVLKALYESVIDAETRRRLGEYYTPDWLAEKIVDEQLRDPLNQRVLDPACGSGTFLFWAIRRVLAACDEKGLSNRAALERVVSHVQGMDLHPVAVTLARVTYLLALTPERLADRGELTVPVFLGDSVRWEEDDTAVAEDGMTVRTSDPLELLHDELHFPEGVVEEPQRFDRLVAELARRAGARKPGTKPPKIGGLLNRHHVQRQSDRDAVEIAFKKLCRLHDDGRDHVWSYYIRNLMRPLSFSRPEGQSDVLVGNPPWLAFRAMPPKLQRTYRSLAQERGLWAGGKVATHQDLSDLFVARAVEQYLKPNGVFAFVMPFAALSRRQFAGFRAADWSAEDKETRVTFAAPEEFAKVKPPLFGVPSCVVSGVKSPIADEMPTDVISWTGRVPDHQVGWTSASQHLEAAGRGVAVATDSDQSPYRARFRQGATLVPRMLVSVDRVPTSPIGISAGQIAVQSKRSPNEKMPWKELPSLEGVVEERFVRPMHLGATIVAYRARDPQRVIVPRVDGNLIDGSNEQLDEVPGLAAWWRKAEAIWDANKSGSSRLTLLQQVDYQGKLHKQFPVVRERVVYTKSGQHLAACRIDKADAVIDHTLYWAPVESEDEGRYLCAILNSQPLAEAISGLQSRGQHNPRHFDMHVFALGFPLFDPEKDIHALLSELAGQAEQIAGEVEFDGSWQFQKARRMIREALVEDGVAAEIDTAVAELIAERASQSQRTRSPTPDLLAALKAPEEAGSGGAKRKPGPRKAESANTRAGRRRASRGSKNR